MSFVRPEPIADYAFYFTRAIELAEGKGYNFQGHSTAFFPVGTSLVLAAGFSLFGHALTTAHAMMLIASAFSVFFVYRITLLVACPTAASIAALVLALHPDWIALSSLVASENFFVPFLLGSLYYICRPLVTPADSPVVAYASAGLLFGAALLVRSTVVIVLPLLAIGIVLWTRGAFSDRVRNLAVFTACFMMIVAPWVARNIDRMQAPVLTTNGGISLWWGNNPHASGGFPLSTALPVQDLSSVQSEVANNARFQSTAFGFIKERPGDWLALAPYKLRFLFMPVTSEIGFSLRYRYRGGPWAIESHPRLGDSKNVAEAEYEKRELGTVESKLIGGYYHTADGGLAIGLQGIPWVLGSVGLVMLAWRNRARLRLVLLIAIVPVTWIAFHVTLGNGQPRYLLSAVPFMLVGLGYLVATLWGSIPSRRPSKRSS